MKTITQPTKAQVESAIKQAEAEQATAELKSDVLAEIAAPAPTLGGRAIAALSWARKLILARAMDTITPRKKGESGEDEPDIADEDAAMMTLYVMASDGWECKRMVDKQGGNALLKAAFALADQSDPAEYDAALQYAGMKMNALAAASKVSGPSAGGPGNPNESSAEKNAPN
jgi:hypothetical protein